MSWSSTSLLGAKWFNSFLNRTLQYYSKGLVRIPTKPMLNTSSTLTTLGTPTESLVKV